MPEREGRCAPWSASWNDPTSTAIGFNSRNPRKGSGTRVVGYRTGVRKNQSVRRLARSCWRSR
jgi:hypothetical protein